MIPTAQRAQQFTITKQLHTNTRKVWVYLIPRRLEMSLRRHDVEQWMSHRRLPEELRRRVPQAEQYIWAATRGVNEEILLENLPEDPQRDIRRHLFMFIKKVRIFSLMDEHILDAICERLRQKTYIGGQDCLQIPTEMGLRNLFMPSMWKRDGFQRMKLNQLQDQLK
ncbi:probable cyclic nucleotide-gated ion channel 20, chloroplastic [Ziziphus jujuba]|uniref:Probable cyclic nucleotide-gated ion channel 20, chloroplastic n=1 Tax=Ziziphus jujuba TaxID=326968 RepID=A0ABM3ZZT8_ZIZJJ|nr:probable cyclic nucleotide-gated ion channel 20, chloroplastic [Ziziphus jujuba var. spinosa]XP_048329317.1 probable cyclic nucleotide-gated ion channel 20, chloroplastic [Ziziphus jujuba var. spinosa]XP_048329318.1 probable cyclic nucleotide-gated ion channel 20, chloroplastic [Ziziphus jujuba var. spinosa]XP_060669998.1 probable cyclic nucleotide-gated ion channel 20, chloroplastic [Ziziphus jujuba]